MSARALGGGELFGSRMTRSVYLDEAGISHPQHEPIVVVAGVILHTDNQWRALQEHFDSLVQKFVPPESQEGFIFHTHHIWHGTTGTVWDRDVYKGDRRDVLRALCDTIKDFNLGVVLGSAARRHVADTFLEQDGVEPDTNFVTQIAFMTSFVQAAHGADAWTESYADKNECLGIVIENNHDLQKYAKAAFKMIRGKKPDPSMAQFLEGLPLKRVIDAPSFMDKADSPPLQLADFCAFMIKRYFMGRQDIAAYLGTLLPIMIVSLPPSRRGHAFEVLKEMKEEALLKQAEQKRSTSSRIPAKQRSAMDLPA